MSLPAKIKAIGINKAGDFDVIEELELPLPQNAPGNVLVKVRYASSFDTISADSRPLCVCVHRSNMEV